MLPAAASRASALAPALAASEPPLAALLDGFACGTSMGARAPSERACAERALRERDAPYASFSSRTGRCLSCSAAEYVLRVGAGAYAIYSTRGLETGALAPTRSSAAAPRGAAGSGGEAAGARAAVEPERAPAGAFMQGWCWVALSALLVPALALASQQTRGDDRAARGTFAASGGVMASAAASEGHVRRAAAVRTCTLVAVTIVAWTGVGFSLAYGTVELLNGFVASPPLRLPRAAQLVADATTASQFFALTLVRALVLTVGLGSCGVVRTRWPSTPALALALACWLLIGACPPMHWVWGAAGALRARGAIDVSGAVTMGVTAASALCVVARERAMRRAPLGNGCGAAAADDDALDLDLDIDGRSSLCNAPSTLVGGVRAHLSERATRARRARMRAAPRARRGRACTGLLALGNGLLTRAPHARCCAVDSHRARAPRRPPAPRSAPCPRRDRAVRRLGGELRRERRGRGGWHGRVGARCMRPAHRPHAGPHNHTLAPFLFVSTHYNQTCKHSPSCLTSAAAAHAPRRAVAPRCQAVVGGSVWGIFTELRERRRQSLYDKLSLPGMRSSVSFAMLGGAELVATSTDSRPAGGYSDVVIGALMGAACAAVAGGVQPLRVVALQAAAGSALAALAAGSIETLFVRDAAVDEAHGGNGGSGGWLSRGRAPAPASVLDAPSHALILAGLAAVPPALLIAACSPLPTSLAPAEPRATETASTTTSVWAVQLLAAIGSGLWSAAVMQLLLALSRGGGSGDAFKYEQGRASNAAREATASPPHTPSATSLPAARAVPLAHPLSARSATQRPSSPSRTPSRRLSHGPHAAPPSAACGTCTPPCAQAYALANTTPRRRPPPSASQVTVDVPIVLPNGRGATLAIRTGDEIDELVRRFCAAHGLSEDCAPHIDSYLTARFAAPASNGAVRGGVCGADAGVAEGVPVRRMAAEGIAGESSGRLNFETPPDESQPGRRAEAAGSQPVSVDAAHAAPARRKAHAEHVTVEAGDFAARPVAE